MDRRRWVLRLAGMDTPHYLRDYRRREADLWTSNPLQSEPFANFGEAISVARRLSHVLRLPIEAARVGVPRPETCVTLGCTREPRPGYLHCDEHQRRWMGVEIDPDLTPQQVESAFFMACEDNLEQVEAEIKAVLDGVASRY